MIDSETLYYSGKQGLFATLIDYDVYGITDLDKKDVFLPFPTLALLYSVFLIASAKTDIHGD